MKNLINRSIGFALALTLTVFSSVVYVSCNKTDNNSSGIDDCANVVCQNGGSCFKGLCTCPSGFEGEFCGTKSNQRYIGSWKIDETVTGSSEAANVGKTKSYNINVSAKNGTATILNVEGFFGDPSYGDIEWKLALAPEIVELDGDLVELDNYSVPTDYVFTRYQSVANTYITIEKGNGGVNGIGTFLDGICYISYQSSTGPVRDTISYKGAYIQ